MPFAPIRHLTRSQINDEAYDRCIAFSPQRIPYAFSWYQDAVSPGWELLIQGDYERVMPLPVRWRYGIKAVIQPLFCHQLGVFAAHETPGAASVLQFIQALGRAVRYIPSYQFHAANTPFLLTSPGTVLPLTNHVLDLRQSYERIAAGYSKTRRKNIRRAFHSAEWAFEDIGDIEPLISLFREHNTATIGRVAPAAYPTLRRLAQALAQRGQLRIRVAKREGRIEAGNLLVLDQDRLIHLFCAASPVGRAGNARAVIVDQFLREYAGKPLLFDFESPEVENMVTFNTRFGAVPELYARLSGNRLPGALQWLHHVKKNIQQTLRR